MRISFVTKLNWQPDARLYRLEDGRFIGVTVPAPMLPGIIYDPRPYLLATDDQGVPLSGAMTAERYGEIGQTHIDFLTSLGYVVT